MAYQGLLAKEDVVPEAVYEFTGADLIGSKVSAPNGVHPEVYVLPMETVSATKVGLFERYLLIRKRD